MNKVLFFNETEDITTAIISDLTGLGYKVIPARITPLIPFITETADIILLASLHGTANIEEAIRIIDSNTHLARLPIVAIVGEDDLKSLKMIDRIDEVVIYPCSPTEISLRLLLALRKDYQIEADREDEVVRIAGLVIDPVAYEVIVDGFPASLTYKEFELLKYLAKNRGKVCARRTLIEKVWRKHSYEDDMRTVDVHIRRIRAKLGNYSYLITTVKNVGYRFNASVSSVRSVNN